MSFGTFIASRRKAKGLSTTQLAAAIGVGEAYVRHLEKERHVPTLDNCTALADALQLDPADREELVRLVDAGTYQRRFAVRDAQLPEVASGDEPRASREQVHD